MERILVTRATGWLGREVVQRLRSREVEIMAGTHEPQRAAELFGGDVEAVELDYDRTETWDAAVMWADRIVLTPPPFDPQADRTLIPFLDWAVSSGTRHVVLVSAMGIEGLERVPPYRVEQRVRETGVPFTFLRPNWYMQNLLSGFIAQPVRERDELALPAGRAAVSMVDVRDVADAVVAVLEGDVHIGGVCTLTGPAALTHEEVARVLSATAGRTIRYRPVDGETFRRDLLERGWRADQVDVALGLFRAMSEGARAVVTSELGALIGRAPCTFEAFAAEHAPAWQPVPGVARAG